ncbi:MAG: HIT family protein, partial [Polyangiaceae bacterium]|nr:HIT family protein [Polyangiaceae bacterium]
AQVPRIDCAYVPQPAPGWQTRPNMANAATEQSTDCPFCNLPESRIVHANALAAAVRDAYPVAPGHTLVIPRRHAGSFFELHPAEQAAMLALLDQARAALDGEFAPDGYTIGINDGAAAGQTVPHVHLHLIPRHRGDVEDPRGGIRWVLPAKAKYWP